MISRDYLAVLFFAFLCDYCFTVWTLKKAWPHIWNPSKLRLSLQLPAHVKLDWETHTHTPILTLYTHTHTCCCWGFPGIAVMGICVTVAWGNLCVWPCSCYLLVASLNVTVEEVDLPVRGRGGRCHPTTRAARTWLAPGSHWQSRRRPLRPLQTKTTE